MITTKRQIITEAFTELGLASYVHNLEPAELQGAKRRLDVMMAEWIKAGIVFDPVYPQPTDFGGGDIDDDTNAPDDAIEPMFLNLAIRLAPSYGKGALSIDTKIAARQGYSKLLGQFVGGEELALTQTIRGAGAKRPFSPFIEE